MTVGSIVGRQYAEAGSNDYTDVEELNQTKLRVATAAGLDTQAYPFGMTFIKAETTGELTLGLKAIAYVYELGGGSLTSGSGSGGGSRSVRLYGITDLTNWNGDLDNVNPSLLSGPLTGVRICLAGGDSQINELLLSQVGGSTIVNIDVGEGNPCVTE